MGTKNKTIILCELKHVLIFFKQVHFLGCV